MPSLLQLHTHNTRRTLKVDDDREKGFYGQEEREKSTLIKSRRSINRDKKKEIGKRKKDIIKHQGKNRASFFAFSRLRRRPFSLVVREREESNLCKSLFACGGWVAFFLGVFLTWSLSPSPPSSVSFLPFSKRISINQAFYSFSSSLSPSKNWPPFSFFLFPPSCSNKPRNSISSSSLSFRTAFFNPFSVLFFLLNDMFVPEGKEQQMQTWMMRS